MQIHPFNRQYLESITTRVLSWSCLAVGRQLSTYGARRQQWLSVGPLELNRYRDASFAFSVVAPNSSSRTDLVLKTRKQLALETRKKKELSS